MNDVILKWKKLKKFIKSDKTENSIHGKDRGYTDKEIQKILEFSDQRLKTAFLVLASTGISRTTILCSSPLGDRWRISSLVVDKRKENNRVGITWCNYSISLWYTTYTSASPFWKSLCSVRRNFYYFFNSMG